MWLQSSFHEILNLPLFMGPSFFLAVYMTVKLCTMHTTNIRIKFSMINFWYYRYIYKEENILLKYTLFNFLKRLLP